MNPHLIVLDLDGTLLTDEKVISPFTKRALHEARLQGHQVMIATGRPYRASKMYYAQLGLTTPIVNFNGALVHDPFHNNFKQQHTTIQLETVHDIVDSLHHYNLENVVAEVQDDVYIQHYDESLLDIFKMGDPRIETGSIVHTLKTSPTSLLLQATEQTVPSIRQHLADTKANVIDHRRWGDPWHIIEIVHHGIHKAKGVSAVAKTLDIPKNRIIAFGDEDNDLEMLDYVGTGVAMGNAIPELKNIANEITKTNNEDGIGHFLVDRLNLNL